MKFLRRFWNWIRGYDPAANVTVQEIDITEMGPMPWEPLGERGLVISLGHDVGFFFLLPKTYRDLVAKIDDLNLSQNQKIGHIMNVTNGPRNFEVVKMLGTSQAPWPRFTIIGCLVIPAEMSLFVLRPGCRKESTYKLSMGTGQMIPGSEKSKTSWTDEASQFKQEW